MGRAKRNEERSHRLPGKLLSNPHCGEAAFEAFEHAYRPALIKYAQRLLRDQDGAEDAVQSALLEMYRDFEALEQAENPQGWARGILKHICDGIRRKRRLRAFEEPDGRTSQFDIQTAAIDRLATEHILLEVARLPRAQRDVVELICLEGWSIDEASEKMSIKPSAAGVRLLRARAKLQRRLGLTLMPPPHQPTSPRCRKQRSRTSTTLFQSKP